MLKSTKIVVGLGNPGVRYESTRHNIGFLVVDELARRRELLFLVEKDEYLVTSEGNGDNSLVLMKPLTYMNLSGEAVLAWSRRSGIKLTGKSPVVAEFVGDEAGDDQPMDTAPEVTGERPLVICDDLALPLGAVRLRGKGRSGGQNGVESIIDNLEGDEFPRLRLGIAPIGKPVAPEFWADFVLAEFEPDEQQLVKDVVSHAADTVEYWLENTLEKTASLFNRRRWPVPPAGTND